MSKTDVRYGAELRKRARAVDRSRTSAYECPKCSKKSVRRVSNAVWACRSCGGQFAGGTYSLSTPSGDVAARMVKDHAKARPVAKPGQ